MNIRFHRFYSVIIRVMIVRFPIEGKCYKTVPRKMFQCSKTVEKVKGFCFISFHILQNTWHSNEFKTIFKKINKEKDYFEISSEKVACLFGFCNSKSFQNCKSVENAKKASFQKFQVKVHWRKTSWWNGQGSSLVNLLKDNDGIMTSSVILIHSFNIDFNLWILVVMAKFQWSCHLISNELM